jgi:hypothetical protein
MNLDLRSSPTLASFLDNRVDALKNRDECCRKNQIVIHARTFFAKE